MRSWPWCPPPANIDAEIPDLPPPFMTPIPDNNKPSTPSKALEQPTHIWSACIKYAYPRVPASLLKTPPAAVPKQAQLALPGEDSQLPTEDGSEMRLPLHHFSFSSGGADVPTLPGAEDLPDRPTVCPPEREINGTYDFFKGVCYVTCSDKNVGAISRWWVLALPGGRVLIGWLSVVVLRGHRPEIRRTQFPPLCACRFV